MPTKEGQARKLGGQGSIDATPPGMGAKPMYAAAQHGISPAGFARQTSNGVVVSDEDLRKAFQVAALQHSEPFASAPHAVHAHHAQGNMNMNAGGQYEGYTPSSTFLPQGPVEFSTSPQYKQVHAPFFAQPPPLPRPPSNNINPIEPVYAIAAPSFHYQQTPAPHPMAANEWTAVPHGDVSVMQSNQLQLQQMQMQMQMQLAMQQAHQHAMQTPTTAQEMGFFGVRPSFSRENSLTQGFQTKDTMVQQFAGQIGYINPAQAQYIQIHSANEYVQNSSPQYFPGLSRPNSMNSCPGISRPNSLCSSVPMMPHFSRPNSLTSSPGSDSDLPSAASTPLTLVSAQSVESSCDEHSPHNSDNESNGSASSRSQARVKASTHSGNCPTLAHGMCFQHMSSGHSRQGAKKTSSEKCAGHTVLHRFLTQQPGVKAEIQGRIARGLIDSFQLSCTFDGEDVCRNCWSALQFINSPVSKGGLGLPLVVYGVTVYFMDYGDAQKGALRNRGTRRHMTYTADVNGCRGVPLQGEGAMEMSGGKTGGAKKRQRNAIPDSNTRSHFHKLLLPCLPLCPGLIGQFAQAVSAKGAAIYFKLRDCTPTNKKKANKRKILEYDLIAGGSNNLCRLCTSAQKKSVDEAEEIDAEAEHKAANEDDKRSLAGKDFMKSIKLPHTMEQMWLPTSIFNAWEAARKSENGYKEEAIKYEQVSDDKDSSGAANNGKGRTTLRVRKRVKREHLTVDEDGDTANSVSTTASSSSSSTCACSDSSSSLPASIPILSRPNSLTNAHVGYIGSLSTGSSASTSTDFVLGPSHSSLVSMDSSLMLSEGESDVDGEFDVLAFGVDHEEFANPFSAGLLPTASVVAVGGDLMDTSNLLKVAGIEEEGRGAAPLLQKTVSEDSEGRGAALQEDEAIAPAISEQQQKDAADKKLMARSAPPCIRLPISFHADDELFVQLSVNASGTVGIEDALERMSLNEHQQQAAHEVTVKIFVFQLVENNAQEAQQVEEEEEEEEDEDVEDASEAHEEALGIRKVLFPSSKEEAPRAAAPATGLYD